MNELKRLSSDKDSLLIMYIYFVLYTFYLIDFFEIQTSLRDCTGLLIIYLKVNICIILIEFERLKVSYRPEYAEEGVL